MINYRIGGYAEAGGQSSQTIRDHKESGWRNTETAAKSRCRLVRGLSYVAVITAPLLSACTSSQPGGLFPTEKGWQILGQQAKGIGSPGGTGPIASTPTQAPEVAANDQGVFDQTEQFYVAAQQAERAGNEQEALRLYKMIDANSAIIEAEAARLSPPGANTIEGIRARSVKQNTEVRRGESLKNVLKQAKTKIAISYEREGRYPEAAAYYQKALELEGAPNGDGLTIGERLAFLYAHGGHGLPKDEARARQLLSVRDSQRNRTDLALLDRNMLPPRPEDVPVAASRMQEEDQRNNTASTPVGQMQAGAATSIPDRVDGLSYACDRQTITIDVKRKIVRQNERTGLIFCQETFVDGVVGPITTKGACNFPPVIYSPDELILRQSVTIGKIWAEWGGIVVGPPAYEAMLRNKPFDTKLNMVTGQFAGIGNAGPSQCHLGAR